MNQEASQKFQLEPAIFTIFGITGDLAARYLLPALYHLVKDDLLHDHTAIVGISRREMHADELLEKVKLCVLEADGQCDNDALQKFRKKLHIVRLDPVNGHEYDQLLKTLNGIEDKQGMCMNRLFYLAIPPQVYAPVIQNLGGHGLQKGCQHHRAVSRLLVEKPFGYDLESAEELIKHTARFFHEDQVFRIDHYLAKESAQNILVFREQNPLFAAIWDAAHISSIEISALEKIGVEGRGFYDNIGALRDFVQNHLLQLMALVTMELPKTKSGKALHHAKQELLKMVAPIDVGKVVRAQYEGYGDEVGNPHSTTETYAEVPLAIDNNRWSGVLITLRTGKALKAKLTTIIISFTGSSQPTANKLTFRIQPNEGIDIELIAKRPGFDDKTEIVRLDFSYHGAFPDPRHPDAYERVLVDAVRGDHSLFATSDEILAAWRLLQPILSTWEFSSDDLLSYKPGSNGPDVQ